MIVVIGPYCYGAGITLQQAVNRAKYGYGGHGPMPYNAYEASADWEVDQAGTIRASRLQRFREVRIEQGKKVVRTGSKLKND
jgi:hypothetical protein